MVTSQAPLSHLRTAIGIQPCPECQHPRYMHNDICDGLGFRCSPGGDCSCVGRAALGCDEALGAAVKRWEARQTETLGLGGGVKWLKSKPLERFEECIPERPLLHACSGEHGGFGDVTLDSDTAMRPMVLADVRRLPLHSDSFAAAYMDCPWTAAWKVQVAEAMRDLLRVAPVVYVMSPWTYGCRIARITGVWIAWTPGVNQALTLIRYERTTPMRML